MNKRTGWKYMTEKEFNNIKLMQEAGITQKQVQKITERSNNVVNRVYISETFADYQAINQALLDKRRNGVAPLVAVAVPSKVEQSLVDVLRSMSDTLQRIEHKLDE